MVLQPYENMIQQHKAGLISVITQTHQHTHNSLHLYRPSTPHQTYITPSNFLSFLSVYIKLLLVYHATLPIEREIYAVGF